MTDDIVKRVRAASEHYSSKFLLEAADALEEITASREAVWKHAKMLEKDLLAHKERIAELEAALKPFDELSDNFSDSEVIESIRAARAAIEGEKK